MNSVSKIPYGDILLFYIVSTNWNSNYRICSDRECFLAFGYHDNKSKEYLYSWKNIIHYQKEERLIKLSFKFIHSLPHKSQSHRSRTTHHYQLNQYLMCILNYEEPHKCQAIRNNFINGDNRCLSSDHCRNSTSNALIMILLIFINLSLSASSRCRSEKK